jgi:hypothetical protein
MKNKSIFKFITVCLLLISCGLFLQSFLTNKSSINAGPVTLTFDASTTQFIRVVNKDEAPKLSDFDKINMKTISSKVKNEVTSDGKDFQITHTTLAAPNVGGTPISFDTPTKVVINATGITMYDRAGTATREVLPSSIGAGAQAVAVDLISRISVKANDIDAIRREIGRLTTAGATIKRAQNITTALLGSTKYIFDENVGLYLGEIVYQGKEVLTDRLFSYSQGTENQYIPTSVSTITYTKSPTSGVSLAYHNVVGISNISLKR